MALAVLNGLTALCRFVSKTFALWVILFAVLAFCFPSPFLILSPHISDLLCLAMFGMGLTLRGSDFSQIFSRPLDVLIGVVAQFALMPLLAWLLCQALNLPREIAVGVIMIGCCPGGTSSNVMTFAARGDVPLSITMTACTTCLAPLVTPALFYFYASQWVEVDPWSMFIAIVKVVLIPVVAGVLINTLFCKHMQRIAQVAPLLSVIGIVGIVCAVIAVSHDQLATAGVLIILVVILHNGIGYLLGYLVSRALKMSAHKQKAMTFEIGMQNSGLATALSSNYLVPLAAVPGAFFSVWHNISGPIVVLLLNRLNDPEMNTVYEDRPTGV